MLNILGTFPKHSEKSRQTYLEFPQKFRGMSPNFPGMSVNIQSTQGFRWMYSNNPEKLGNILGHVVNHPVKSIKVFQWLYRKQIHFFKNFIWNVLLWRCSTQYSLSAMIGKWRKNMDKGKSCAALLTDLSKAFDCIVHIIRSPESYLQSPYT